MQPPVYYPQSSKPSYQLNLIMNVSPTHNVSAGGSTSTNVGRNEMQNNHNYNHGHGSSYAGYTGHGQTGVGHQHHSFVGSPRSVPFQIHKNQDRPVSQNLSLNLPTIPPQNLSASTTIPTSPSHGHKSSSLSPINPIQHQQSLPEHKNSLKIQNMLKSKYSAPGVEKNGEHGIGIASSRYGEMKTSYMGPDSRQAAYVKDKEGVKEIELFNQSNKNKRVPRLSSLTNIVLRGEQPPDPQQKPQDPKQPPSSLQFSPIQPPSTPTQTLTSIQSAKKLDTQQRFRMRKSSIDPTESFMKASLSTNLSINGNNSINLLINSRRKVEKKYCLMDFQKVKELGTGKYGKVFLVKEKQSQFLCALKIIEKQMLKDQQITEQFIRELKIQLFLNHPNIIKMYGYFDDSINIYIIMQVALGGQLYKIIKKGQSMLQTKVATIMKQVVSAVNELHSNNIIHRDIKPENIVLNQNIVKLCDFGWSVYHGQTLRTTFCGTPLYVSPQILRGNTYDQKIDIWSLGIMMYEMLTGENPFKITQQQQLIKIIKQSVVFPSYINISKQAKDLVHGCLQKNPDERFNIREVVAHQFFKKYADKSPEKKF